MGGFLSDPAMNEAKIAATSSAGREEIIGTTIGPYKVLQQIGEGGYGVVYLAEQCEPVSRRVALKVIKQGMDTRQVIGVRGLRASHWADLSRGRVGKVTSVTCGFARIGSPGGKMVVGIRKVDDTTNLPSEFLGTLGEVTSTV